MNKFWLWMEKKTGFSEFAFRDYAREGIKQMLIGYMIEYLMIYGWVLFDKPKFIDTIDKLYIHLEKLIEEAK